MDEYQAFDDYLEMVIEFGYVTLFASAFPLASFLSMVCNVIEVYSDSFKLHYVIQRPMVRAASSMPRTWYTVLQCICWTAVLTNVLIFGFVSEQGMQFFPSYFKTHEDLSAEHKVRKSGVWLLFALENVLLVAAAFLHHVVPGRPRWVRIALGAQEHRKGEAIREAFKVRLEGLKAKPCTHGS